MSSRVQLSRRPSHVFGGRRDGGGRRVARATLHTRQRRFVRAPAGTNSRPGRRLWGAQMFFEWRSAVTVFVRPVLQPICFTDHPQTSRAGEGRGLATAQQRSATNDSVRYWCVHMLSAATDHLATWSHNDHNILNIMTTRFAFRHHNVLLPPPFSVVAFYLLRRDDNKVASCCKLIACTHMQSISESNY